MRAEELPTNHRILAAGELLSGLQLKSVLDIGCRGGELRTVLPTGVVYCGNDLVQNAAGTVTYVGDALTTSFGQKFDCVIALDVVEHVDDPYALMDRLFELSERYILVSLPNVYDLVHKYRFITRSSLGGKYEFGVSNRRDRHRWVMNYDEIHRFFDVYRVKYGAQLETRNLLLAQRSGKRLSRHGAAVLRRVLGQKVMTQTVMALFRK